MSFDPFVKTDMCTATKDNGSQKAYFVHMTEVIKNTTGKLYCNLKSPEAFFSPKIILRFSLYRVSIN